MAQLFIALTIAFWAVCLPTVEGALRGQQVLTSTDIVLTGSGLTLTENGSSVEADRRVVNMTEKLRPVFLSLPRSEEGDLDASAVRYLLHRYFIDRDGWFVQGSDASGEAANNSLPEVVLKGGALARILSERLAARGMSLHEVAVLATALETLAKSETERRLQRAYQIVGLSHRKDHATESELSLILDVYMQMYTLGKDHEVMTWSEINETWKVIHTVYPRWNELKSWANSVRSEVLASTPEQRGSYHGEARVVDELQHRYGRWQDQQCLSIKKALQEHSTPGKGRIPLSRFYSTDLPGGWKPIESREYLKHMGALDDGDDSNPSVVIPNYFDSLTNCVATSKFYSVCCISECEALLGHLERKLGSPNALPQQIVEIVQHLPSSTVETPRTLPEQLVKRLESVANLHGGHAPLHGRLFRQWMHHAFPDECSYPALSFTQKLMTPSEFQLQTGLKAVINPVDLQRQTQRSSKKAMSAAPEHFTFEVDSSATSVDDGLEELPWSDDEEIFITCPASPRSRQVPAAWVPFRRISRAGLLLAVAVSMALLLVRARRNARAPPPPLLA